MRDDKFECAQDLLDLYVDPMFHDEWKECILLSAMRALTGNFRGVCVVAVFGNPEITLARLKFIPDAFLNLWHERIESLEDQSSQ